MEQPNILSFSEGFYYLYLKVKYIHQCHCQHNINVSENTTITIFSPAMFMKNIFISTLNITDLIETALFSVPCSYLVNWCIWCIW